MIEWSRCWRSCRRAISRAPLAFVEKASALLLNDIHLLILDLFPPGRRDPHGVHAAIWADVTGEAYRIPTGKSLTVVSYEVCVGIRAYLKHIAVADLVPDMPLFLKADACVTPPLETTYQTAYRAMPSHWRDVLESV